MSFGEIQRGCLLCKCHPGRIAAPDISCFFPWTEVAAADELCCALAFSCFHPQLFHSATSLSRQHVIFTIRSLTTPGEGALLSDKDLGGSENTSCPPKLHS
jgi:hypothetical protein